MGAWAPVWPQLPGAAGPSQLGSPGMISLRVHVYIYICMYTYTYPSFFFWGGGGGGVGGGGCGGGYKGKKYHCQS